MSRLQPLSALFVTVSLALTGHANGQTVAPVAALERDHVFLWTSPGAPEADSLRALGLTLDEYVNHHVGQGTSSKGFWFENAYLELIWIDNDSIAQEAGRRFGTDLLARAAWRKTGAAPFGVGLHRANDSLEGLPFATKDYWAEWMPRGTTIAIALSAHDIREPMFFVVPPSFAVRPLEKLSATRQERRRALAAHQIGLRRLSAIRIILSEDRPLSATEDVLVRAGVLSIERGPGPLIELTFDGGVQGRVLDASPSLPLRIRF